MNEHIDKKIVLKIKERLLNHNEAYQEGAWEKFLEKKKEKKRRIIFWYFRGVAASVIIIVVISFSFLKNTSAPINDKNIITEEEVKVPNNHLKEEKINKKMFDSEKKKTATNNPLDTTHVQNDLKHKIDLKSSKNTNGKYIISNNNSEGSNNSHLKHVDTNQKPLNKESEKTSIAETNIKPHSNSNKSNKIILCSRKYCFIRRPIKH